MSLPALMTVKELADYLHVHVSTIYRLLKRNKLPRLKIGSDYRFFRAEIDEWTKKRQLLVRGKQ